MILVMFRSYNSNTAILVNPEYVYAVGECFPSNAKPEDEAICRELWIVGSTMPIRVVETLTQCKDKLVFKSEGASER